MHRIGRYQIEARIGEGAMADVYKAYDPEIGRAIAIKTLKHELAGNDEIVQRFLREARAAGALSHPNIVTIHDVGEADGHPYIAMELLEGEPLDQYILARGALPLDQALALGAQLARAVHYAHEAGVIHRDMKPSNIVLCGDSRIAKLLDFGIARLGEPDPLRAELNALRTQVGQVLGTPRYMSPEQALGHPIDRRSDLFSLGVVLYEMVTGRMAFDGASLATLAIQITQQKPQPLAAAMGECPKGLQYLVDRLLAKDPDKRFASGADLADAIDRERDALDGKRLGRGLPLGWRLSLAMTATMSVALMISLWAVLDRQYRSMEHMALTSGTTITSFVANNVGLRSAENAGLAANEQDWAPVQAFVDVAAQSQSVRRILVIDARGLVRGSSEAELLGWPGRTRGGERVLSDTADERITMTEGRDFRFRRTIRYAGQPFGTVELVMRGSDLADAASDAKWQLGALGLVLLLVIVAVGHATARVLVQPLRQLKGALDEAARGNLAFRVSHRRRDEFGAVFDAYNRLADSIENSPLGLPAGPTLEATRIALPGVVTEPNRRSA